MCEERRGHEHAFLKIYKQEQVPKAMFTVVDEKMPNCKPDIEQNVNNEQQQFPTFFRNMMGQWMEGMKGFGHHARGGFGPNNGGGRGGRWGGGGGHCGQWKMKKAQLISYPKDVIIGKPGEVLFADVEIENGMHWPWKEGSSLQSDYTNVTAEVLDEVSLPVDWAVPEKSKFKVCIPIKIKDCAKSGEQVYEANFTFHGGRGMQFGDTIPLKIKVMREIPEIEYYQTGMSIFEKQEGKPTSLQFNEIVDILKSVRNDEAKCLEIIAQK